jgi:predicted nucleic acid-binding protein
MAIALDTSVLVAWEKAGGLPTFLEAHEGPFYVPAHAAAEFLLGTHPPVRADLRERARRLYETHIKGMVAAFDEPDAAQLAALNAELRTKGQTMNFYDAAIAATVLSRKDDLLALDSDYDRLKDRLKLVSV